MDSVQFNKYYWVSTLCQAMSGNIAVNKTDANLFPHYILEGETKVNNKFIVE